MSKMMKKTMMSTLATVLVCVLLVIGSVASFAWFASHISSGHFPFRTGTSDNMALQIARVRHNADTEATESARVYSDIVGSHIEANEDGTRLAAIIDNMSFGSIDNVAQWKPENVVYLRLRVPTSVGDTVKLRMYFLDAEYLSLFRKPNADEGTDFVEVTTEQILQDLYGLTDENADPLSFLSYSVILSNEAYAADAISTALDFDAVDAASQQDFFVLTQDDIDADSYDALTLTNESYDALDATDPDSCYYVYIRVTPNLSTFALATETIFSIMPCRMFFRIGATFEAYDAQISD